MDEHAFHFGRRLLRPKQLLLPKGKKDGGVNIRAIGKQSIPEGHARVSSSDARGASKAAYIRSHILDSVNRTLFRTHEPHELHRAQSSTYAHEKPEVEGRAARKVGQLTGQCVPPMNRMPCVIRRRHSFGSFLVLELHGFPLVSAQGILGFDCLCGPNCPLLLLCRHVPLDLD